MITEIIGQGDVLTAAPIDTNGNPMTFAQLHTITWSSSDPTVATVTGSGTDLTAQQAGVAAGTATITVVCTDQNGGSATGTLTVTVTAPPPPPPPSIASVSIVPGPVS